MVPGIQSQTMDELSHILEQARDLIAQKGFAATSLEDIAEASGVAVSLLTETFKRRENVLFILTRQTLHNLLRLSKAATVGAKNPAETLERLIKVFINFTENNTDEMIVLAKADPTLLLDMSRFPNKECNFLREEYLDLYQSAIAWGVAEKYFDGVDPAKAAKVIVLLLFGTGGQLCRDFNVSYLSDEILAFVLKRFSG
jgi:AcrR family transcriptional regulator